MPPADWTGCGGGKGAPPDFKKALMNLVLGVGTSLDTKLLQQGPCSVPHPKECFDCPGLPETFSWGPRASSEVSSAQPGPWPESWGHVGSSPFVTTYLQERAQIIPD